MLADSLSYTQETNMPTQAIDKTTSTVSNATTATTVTKKVCQRPSSNVYLLIKNLHQRPSLPSLHSLQIQVYLFRLLRQQYFSGSAGPRYDRPHRRSSCCTLFQSRRQG